MRGDMRGVSHFWREVAETKWGGSNAGVCLPRVTEIQRNATLIGAFEPAQIRGGTTSASVTQSCW